mmetsp:Transcript_34577/g.42589  ORF Transcript_34577/g.42589 Transcript_34577/m.42589 type:complete len:90 (-) Transcript_34577:91-360(-)
MGEGESFDDKSSIEGGERGDLEVPEYQIGNKKGTKLNKTQDPDTIMLGDMSMVNVDEGDSMDPYSKGESFVRPPFIRMGDPLHEAYLRE